MADSSACDLAHLSPQQGAQAVCSQTGRYKRASTVFLTWLINSHSTHSLTVLYHMDHNMDHTYILHSCFGPYAGVSNARSFIISIQALPAKAIKREQTGRAEWYQQVMCMGTLVYASTRIVQLMLRSLTPLLTQDCHTCNHHVRK